MSTVVRPSGPLPPRVYWTRRLLLVAVLCVVAWAVLRLTSGSDPGAQAEGAGPAPSAESSAPASGQRRRQHSAAPPGVSLVTARYSDAGERCDPGAVSVQPQVSSPVRSGEPVPVQLRITASTTRACTLNLDASSLLVAVTSGERPIWSSTQCTAAVPARSLVLQPHWSTLIEVTWSGQLARESCDSSEPVARAGSYTVQAALVEGEPGAADFELRPAQRAANEDPKQQDRRPRERPKADQT